MAVRRIPLVAFCVIESKNHVFSATDKETRRARSTATRDRIRYFLRLELQASEKGWPNVVFEKKMYATNKIHFYRYMCLFLFVNNYNQKL